ncbi:unnamed protein product [Vitrella brassicaformis CCMP3155]|uniref:FGGY carbohydrate kinase domain-containing protein n=1 Tax=Vitrella brassicaformis (strain CCMP3155) TaxID=1169540 RepID=A0A0G4GM11_VITBC|nr:unnamed protein product [Vitrella brassicaformis CCMP3155]|mmetsp:Transcript_7296/g.21015  ORF Transcript_7296/g.21015 Transcript_7296/m.21015 type:complete len:579 (+) Transcript_7296:57-1793(+)|eukprot:CEM31167.1 unnamed protein product [Vitrella brassicaformis CCMP3155]
MHVGVDVGTGSVRAAVFDIRGHSLSSASLPISTHTPLAEHYEQASDEIWQQCCNAVRQCLSAIEQRSQFVTSGENTVRNQVESIAFDATCSLVVLDGSDRPVSVTPTGVARRSVWNVILWMDHRAVAQADRINSTNHPVLGFVGGKVSPEMEWPKVLWLKEHLPQSFGSACGGKLMDLTDYLTYRATGVDERSQCTVTCKWNWIAPEAASLLPQSSEPYTDGWTASFLQEIGVAEFVSDAEKARAVKGQSGVGVRPLAAPVGNGLSAKAASELGLRQGCAVGVGLIDAHAGGIGLLSLRSPAPSPSSFPSRLAMVSGTSTCYMFTSDDAVKVPGVWGPYYGAMLPDKWLLEAGQSATGSFIDHLLVSHAARYDPPLADKPLHDVHRHLAHILMQHEGEDCPTVLTKDIHMTPDVHGNRSPFADPHKRGVVVGASLERSVNHLAVMYLAALQAVAYGCRHIMQTVESKGHPHIETICLCGGLAKSPLFAQQCADILQRDVLIAPEETDAVLLGSAIIGAAALEGGGSDALLSAMQRMGPLASLVRPTSKPSIVDLHDRKYGVFVRMMEFEKECRDAMHS